MEERIQRDIMSAMKEKNEVKLASLRAIKTAIMQTKTSPNFKGDRDSTLPDSEVIKIMQKLVKEREDSSNIYIAAGRNDLADKEIKELNIIKEYLPQQLSENEVQKIVEEAIAETNATSIKDMGKVMGLVTKRINGQSDGKTISSIIKKMLS